MLHSRDGTATDAKYQATRNQVWFQRVADYKTGAAKSNLASPPKKHTPCLAKYYFISVLRQILKNKSNK